VADPAHTSAASVLHRPLTDLPDPLPIPTIPTGRGHAPFFARIRPPGSKSLTNRALLLAALTSGQSRIHQPLLGADDSDRMLAALRQLGARIDSEPNDTLLIHGVGGRWRPDLGQPPAGNELRLDLNNAGTATRFLAAAAALSPIPIIIDGNERMRQRPIGELAEALADLGLQVDYLGKSGCPPLRLVPPAELPVGASLKLPTTLSSQFISALLLIAPWLPGGLTLTLDGRITSRSYIQMTLGLLDQIGATVKSADSLRVLRVGPPPNLGPGPAPRGLPPFDYTVEPDASGATYFWAAAALVPGAVCRVEGLDSHSLQGDAQFPDTLARMGATVIREESAGSGAHDSSPPAIGIRGPSSLAPVMADMASMPDAALSLAVVASFATGRSIIRGLRTLRHKETDRIAALQVELAKLGIGVETKVLGDPDAITIAPPPNGIDCSATAPRIEFDTYDDHRMAMSLALIGLRRPNTFIRGPRCVGKTYPHFWRDLATLV